MVSLVMYVYLRYRGTIAGVRKTEKAPRACHKGRGNLQGELVSILDTIVFKW